MTELAVLCSIFFLIGCIAAAIAHSIRCGRVTLLAWSLLAMGGIYGGGGALVAIVTSRGGNPLWARWLIPYEHQYPMHTLSALIVAAATIFGWFLAGAAISSRSNGQSRTTPHYARLHVAAWILLAIAVSAQLLYSHAYGGLLGVLEYSILIRSGIFTIVNPLSFLYPFAGLAMFSSFLFFGLCAARRSALTRFGFFAAFVFALYVLTSWLGRIGFLAYLATFILATLFQRKVAPVPLLIGGGTTMVAVVLAAYQVSTWLDLKSANSLTSFLARELSFPFVSYFAQLNTGVHLLRGFRDIFFAPAYLLPSSWWSGWLENVSQVNTSVVMGAAKGEYGVTGGIPVDLVTLGLMQAGALGIAGIGLLFGAMLRAVERLLYAIRDDNIRAPLEAFAAIKLAALAVFYAHPEHVVSNNFPFLVSAAVIALCLRVPRVQFVSAVPHARSHWHDRSAQQQ